MMETEEKAATDNVAGPYSGSISVGLEVVPPTALFMNSYFLG